VEFKPYIMKKNGNKFQYECDYKLSYKQRPFLSRLIVHEKEYLKKLGYYDGVFKILDQGGYDEKDKIWLNKLEHHNMVQKMESGI